MIRFTAYRREMNERDTHNELQKNDESEPQYEGVVFTDGTCVLRWLTPLRSHSVWDSFISAMGVHGHPEYGTDIVFHDPAYDLEIWWDLRVADSKKEPQKEEKS